MIDLATDQMDIVLGILDELAPHCEARAYGPRATGTVKGRSDLDLALLGPDPLPQDVLRALREALQESELGIRVNVSDWQTFPDDFRQAIAVDCVVIRKVEFSKRREITLGEICDLRSGSVFPRAAQGNRSGDYPFIKVSDMNLSANATCIQDANNWLDHSALPRLKATPLPIGTTVFAKIGEGLKQNRLRFLGQPTIVDNNMMGAVPDTEIVDPRYFFYAMSQFDFGNIANGSALPYLAVDDIYSLELQLPPMADQRRIAQILGALDDKIELNRRMNETLDAMCRALFHSWFVDFDPVRAKLDGRWRRGESLPGLPADRYDRFPDHLVSSELGDIPEGWAVKPLKDCYRLTMGQSPPGSTYNEDGDGLPFFQGNADFGFRYPSNRRYCNAPTRTAKPDDTLVSVRAPVGAINMAWEHCCIGRGLAALRHKSGSSSFTYYAVQAMQREIQQYENTGTVFGSINKQQFETLLVLEPPADVIVAFQNLVKDENMRIRQNVAASRTLADLRDGLLTKLVNGDIRI